MLPIAIVWLSIDLATATTLWWLGRNALDLFESIDATERAEAGSVFSIDEARSRRHALHNKSVSEGNHAA